MAASAYRDKKGEWVIPQTYFLLYSRKKISRKNLLEKLKNTPLLQEAIRLSSSVKYIIEKAKKERCVPGYNANGRFYDHYKPMILASVGWEANSSAPAHLKTSAYYDAVYEAVYELLPGDEWDIYPDGIMPNGMFCPTWQERYGREYP